MNQPNLTVIESIYEAFGRGDAAFIAGMVKPEARWDFNVTESDVPWHVPVTGPAEIPKFLAAFGEHVAIEVFEPRQFIVMGDEVIAHIHLAYTVRRTGKRVDQEQLHWWTVRDRKVTRLRHFEDTAQVLAAWQR
jgi:hypothetical protein